MLSAAARRGEALARRHNWLGSPSEPSAPGDIPGQAETAQAESGEDRAWGGDVNLLLHALRSIELGRMPRASGTVLSAGCSGTLYFDWLRECYGPIDRHIGLELYLPEPDELPAGVEWLKASVADMTGVPDGSISLAFSGQNFEHLFGDDAVDFLLECHRVLEVGGHLVIDSPNRDVASAATWTQPEHTIEFTPGEGAELVTLAGFDVTAVRGVWLCVDPQTGQPLDLFAEHGQQPAAQDILRRAMLAADNPEGSFIWWLEATRSTRPPDVDALRARHAEIFRLAWAERQQRLSHLVGSVTATSNGRVVSVAQGEAGWAMFGPYMPLTPSRYEATFTVRRQSPCAPDAVVVELDIATGGGVVLAQRAVLGSELPEGEWVPLVVAADVDELVWGGQFRAHSSGEAAVDIQFRSDVRFDASAVGPSQHLGPVVDG